MIFIWFAVITVVLTRIKNFKASIIIFYKNISRGSIRLKIYIPIKNKHLHISSLNIRCRLNPILDLKENKEVAIVFVKF